MPTRLSLEADSLELYRSRTYVNRDNPDETLLELFMLTGMARRKLRDVAPAVAAKAAAKAAAGGKFELDPDVDRVVWKLEGERATIRALVGGVVWAELEAALVERELHAETIPATDLAAEDRARPIGAEGR